VSLSHPKRHGKKQEKRKKSTGTFKLEFKKESALESAKKTPTASLRNTHPAPQLPEGARARQFVEVVYTRQQMSYSG
jgi:hypothetical protein